MVAFSHYMKKDTSIIIISHCIKLVKAVCLDFLYKPFKNMANKQTPCRTLLLHTIMSAPIDEKFLL